MAAAAASASTGTGGDVCNAVPSFDCAALRTRQALEARLIASFAPLFGDAKAQVYVLKCLKQLGFPDSVDEPIPADTIPEAILDATPQWKSLCEEIEICRVAAMTEEQRAAEQARLEERDELDRLAVGAFKSAIATIGHALFPGGAMGYEWSRHRTVWDRSMMLHSLGVLSLKDLIILTSCAPGVVEREEAMARCLGVVRGEHAEVWRALFLRLRREGVTPTLTRVSAAFDERRGRIVSRVMEADCSDEGDNAAAGAHGSEVEVCDLRSLIPSSADWSAGSVTEEVLRNHGTSTLGVCLLDVGRRVVATADGGGMSVWSVRSSRSATGPSDSQLVRAFGTGSSHLHGLCVSPDESLIVTSCGHGSVKLWTANGEAVRTLREAPSGDAAVRSVCFSADGRRVLAAGHHEQALLELDVLGGGVLRSIPSGGGLRCVDASRDGKWVVTSDGSGRVKIWDATSLAEVAALDGSGSSCIWGVRFSPDCTCVAATSNDKHLLGWRVSDWSKKLDIEAHSTGAFQVCWSADSKQIVTSGRDGLVKVWEASSGRLLKTLHGHAGFAWGVAMSLDGRLIASCGEDHVIRLWHHEA